MPQQTDPLASSPAGNHRLIKRKFQRRTQGDHSSCPRTSSRGGRACGARLLLPQLLHVLLCGPVCPCLAAILPVGEGFSLISSMWNVFEHVRLTIRLAVVYNQTLLLLCPTSAHRANVFRKTIGNFNVVSPFADTLSLDDGREVELGQGVVRRPTRWVRRRTIKRLCR